MRSLVENMVRLREARDWSQNELAEKSGVNQSTISNIEAGKSSPSIDTLEPIAKALGVGLSVLINDYGDSIMNLRMLAERMQVYDGDHPDRTISLVTGFSFTDTECGAYTLIDALGITLGSIVEGYDWTAPEERLEYPFTWDEYRSALIGIDEAVDAFLDDPSWENEP